MLVGILAIPTFAFAQSTTTPQTTEQLQAQMTSLLAQISALQAQLKTVKEQATQVQKDLKLTRSLSLGSEGDDVKSLQQWLSQFPDIYPEGKVTGHYGKLTEKAIKRYQKKYGLEQAGRIGPKTREHMNNMWGHDKDDKKDNKDDDNDGKGKGKIEVCHEGHTITVAERALKAHLAHGDVKGECGTATTTPDTTAPIISNISATPTTTSALVSWTTNEVANSKVLYATTSPVVGAGNVLAVENASNVTSHSLMLTGLTASTTYYYIVISKDAAGNTATSTQGSFVTSAIVIPDTTAPVISSVSAIVSSTTAMISWTTNEAANTKVKYATTTPVLSAATILTTDSASLVTSHSLTLTGLTASTTYYYLPISADAANNSTTGTEATFFTLGI